jgi:hypothetical protein
MKNISVHLQQFIAGSLHPKALSGQRFSKRELEKWKDYINKEIGKISIAAFRAPLAERNHKGRFVSGLFIQVIELSNVINCYQERYHPAWKHHQDALLIKEGYHWTCLAFERFLDNLLKSNPVIAGRTRFTNFMRKRINVELKAILAEIKGQFVRQGINPVLSEVVSGGIENLIDSNSFLRLHDTYLRRLMSNMFEKKINTDTLTDFLIVNDFNLPDFFLFCVTSWSAQLSTVDGLLDQKDMLLELKSKLFDLSLANGLKFPTANDHLCNELNRFLTEKYALVKERLKVSRQLIADDGKRQRAKRMLINLSVAQLGLFIRLQVEKGIFAKEHIGELFTFFARNFYTPNTEYISAESLQKKSSDVEHATAKKLKAHLIAMLNWLNTNYNLSNYN